MPIRPRMTCQRTPPIAIRPAVAAPATSQGCWVAACHAADRSAVETTIPTPRSDKVIIMLASNQVFKHDFDGTTPHPEPTVQLYNVLSSPTMFFAEGKRRGHRRSLPHVEIGPEGACSVNLTRLAAGSYR
jgi:hypothetical protein